MAREGDIRKHPPFRVARAAMGLQWRSARSPTIGLLVLTTLAGAAPTAAALLTRSLLDHLSSHSHAGGWLIALLGVGIAGAGGASLAAAHLAEYAGAVIRYRVGLEAEARLFEKVNQLSGLRTLEDPLFHDRLRLAGQAADEAPRAVGQLVQDGLRGMVTIATFAAALIAIWPPMFGLLVAGSLPALLARIANARRETQAMEAAVAMSRRRALFRSLLIDLRAAKEIRLFGLGRLFHGRLVGAFRESNTPLLDIERRGAVVQSVLTLGGSVLAAGGTAIVALGAANGRFSVGDVTLFLAALVGVQGAFATIVIQSGQASRGVRLFRNYLDVLSVPNDFRTTDRAPRSLRSKIAFHDVWFRYDPGGAWALRGVDFVIPAGRTIGLVGPNGAGKSTLVKLLCRLYDPDRGRVLWDGVDLRDLEVTELRRRIAVTFQDFMTYELSAAENVGLGDIPHLSDRERIRGAARKAGIDGRLGQLPRGYDTLLSRTFGDPDEECPGALLSGGEWQRVAVARTLMRNQADVLILDEPSSNLDAYAEHELQVALRETGGGRTRLLVSHRLSAIRDADLIVVLADGRVVEQGTHDELMSADGRYAALFRLQARRYQDPRVGALEAVG